MSSLSLSSSRNDRILSQVSLYSFLASDFFLPLLSPSLAGFMIFSKHSPVVSQSKHEASTKSSAILDNFSLFSNDFRGTSRRLFVKMLKSNLDAIKSSTNNLPINITFPSIFSRCLANFSSQSGSVLSITNSSFSFSIWLLHSSIILFLK